MATRKKSRSKRASTPPRGALANVMETGQHIWLAGLGALARAQSEGPKLFEALVLEGSDFQDRQREVVRERTSDLMNALRTQLDTRSASVRDKATETFDNLEEMLQTRVLKALQQLGVPTSHEIDALSRKVQELNRSVQALAHTKAGTAAGRRRAMSAAAAQQAAV